MLQGEGGKGSMERREEGQGKGMIYPPSPSTFN